MISLLWIFCLYVSTIPYALFLCIFNRNTKALPPTLLYMIPATPFFYLIYNFSLTIPNAVTGMLVKTILSRTVYAFTISRTLKKSFLTIYFESYLVMPVIAVTEIILSFFIDMSGFSMHLNPAGSLVSDSIIGLIASAIEMLAAWPFAVFLRKLLDKNIIPFRYTCLAVLSFGTVSLQGAFFFYLNTTDNSVPLLLLAGIILASAAIIVGTLYLMVNESAARASAEKLPIFTSAEENMRRQMSFLESQAEKIRDGHRAAEEYRNAGDLSKSINDVFAVHTEYRESLYTDNPVINTLLQYYAHHFEETGIPYSFSVTCSTYTPLSDYLLIYLISGLLDSVKNQVTFCLGRTANIYIIRLQTSGIAYGAISLLTENAAATALPDTELSVSHRGEEYVIRIISSSEPALNTVN